MSTDVIPAHSAEFESQSHLQEISALLETEELPDRIIGELETRWEDHEVDVEADAYNAFWWMQALERAEETGQSPDEINLFYDDPYEITRESDDSIDFNDFIEVARALAPGNYDELIDKVTDTFFERKVVITDDETDEERSVSLIEALETHSLVVMINHPGYIAGGKAAHPLSRMLKTLQPNSGDPRKRLTTTVGPGVLTKGTGAIPDGELLTHTSGRVKTLPQTRNAEMPDGLRHVGMKIGGGGLRAMREIKNKPGEILIIAPTGTNDEDGDIGPAATSEGIATAIKLCAPSEKCIAIGMSIVGEDDDPVVGAEFTQAVVLDREAMFPKRRALQDAILLFEEIYWGETNQEARIMHEEATDRFEQAA